jgi:hypothetical protein
MVDVRTMAEGPLDPTPTSWGLERTASSGGEIGEGRSGVRRPAREARTPSLSTIPQAARELPVLGEVDVLVCGGGPAGFAAAVSAARQGAETLLLEQHGCLGGMATVGLVIPHFDCWLNDGINAEWIGRMRARNAWGARYWRISYDPEQAKGVCEEMVLESGADLLYHALADGAIVEGDALMGATLATKSGRAAVLARTVVDATGDGDLAARAGAPFVKGREEDGVAQACTLMFRLGGVDWVQIGARELAKRVAEAAQESGAPYRLAFQQPWLLPTPQPGVVIAQLTHMRGVDGTDMRQVTRAEIDGRRQAQAFVTFVREHVPALRDAYLIDTATALGVRETRHILGEYVLAADDVRAGQKFDDGIATASFPIDIHSSDDTSQIGEHLSGVYDIPYRSLVPRQVDGLLTAGRCISGDHVAHASYRVKGPCMAMGQAAGVAAAICSARGVTPRALDPADVRVALREQGVRLDATERPDPGLSNEVKGG